MTDINDIPEEIRRSVLADLLRYPSRRQPYWIQIMGIPGAGKSELVAMLAKSLDFRAPHAMAGTDEYLVRIPAFHATSDREAAFRAFDPIATAFGLEVHRHLIAQKSDVVFERSLAGIDYRDFMYEVKRAGYKMVMIRVDVDFDVAKARAEARESAGGRHVPLSVMRERVALVQDRWEEMKALADSMLELKNNGEKGVAETFFEAVKFVRDFVQGLSPE